MKPSFFPEAGWSACRALLGIALLAVATPAGAQVIRKTVYLSRADYAKKYGAAKPSRSAPASAASGVVAMLDPVERPSESGRCP